MMSDKVRESIQVALEQLHDERERIEGAIAKLEGFLGNLINSATASIKPTLRGRTATPSKTSREPVVAKQRSRAGWTDDARDAAAERMRKYWAERREASAQGKNGARKSNRERKARSNEGAANDSKERSRKGWTDEAREAARERMRKYWADRKNQGATG